MPSVSDDDVRKRLLEKPRFELAAQSVFRLGRWEGLWASTGKGRLPTVDRLTGGDLWCF